MNRLFALSDPHLGFSVDKPMDVFGDRWKDHPRKIEDHWRRSVSGYDTVLVPGDISWGMNFREAEADLEFIQALPGTKYICRGNHDYWWTSLRQVSEFTGDSIIPLQRTAVDCGRFILAASRGWSTPLWEGYRPAEDDRIYAREIGRMAIALEKAEELRKPGQKLVYMMHYPPVVDGRPSRFAELLAASRVNVCVYGHLHGTWSSKVNMTHEGVEYIIASADYLNFKPLDITDRII